MPRRSVVHLTARLPEPDRRARASRVVSKLKEVGLSPGVVESVPHVAVEEGPLEELFRTRPRVLRVALENPVAPFGPAETLSWIGVDASPIDCTGEQAFWRPPVPAVPLFGPPPRGVAPDLAVLRDELDADVPETGRGVRVAIVDTGLVHRVVEDHVVGESGTVVLGHPAWGEPQSAIIGVWALGAGPAPARGAPLTGTLSAEDRRSVAVSPARTRAKVRIIYRTLHPFFRERGEESLSCSVDAVEGADPVGDELGHGSAVAACLHAVAPDARVASVKYTDGSLVNAPIAAFARAVQLRPDVIVCSWAIQEREPELDVLIDEATAAGTLVVFGGGNGHSDEANSCPQVVSHPDVLLVGGAIRTSRESLFGRDPTGRLPGDGASTELGSDGGPSGPLFGPPGAPAPPPQVRTPREPLDATRPVGPSRIFAASPLASGFESATVPWRHCPDLAGMMGPYLVPVQPGSRLDRHLDLAAEPGSGWVRLSGTSLAAPQVAGVVALLLERFPELRGHPNDIKNVLVNGARDVTAGQSAQGRASSAGWDPSCGWGLVSASRALNWLVRDEFVPFIRTTVLDTGAGEPPDEPIWNSPDIIVYNALHELASFGIRSRHRDDQGSIRAAAAVFDTSPAKLALRIQNRGTKTGTIYATSFLVCGNDRLNIPSTWRQLHEPEPVVDLRPGEFRTVVGLPARHCEEYASPTMMASILVVLHHPGEDPRARFPDDPQGLGAAIHQLVRSDPRIAWRWFVSRHAGGSSPVDPLDLGAR